MNRWWRLQQWVRDGWRHGRYRYESPTQVYIRRQQLVLIGLVVVFIVFLARVLYLQVLNHYYYIDDKVTDFRKSQQRVWTRSVQKKDVLVAKRGVITDSRGRVLAQGLPTFHVVVNPFEVDDYDANTYAELAQAVGMRVEDIQKVVQKRKALFEKGIQSSDDIVKWRQRIADLEQAVAKGGRQQQRHQKALDKAKADHDKALAQERANKFFVLKSHLPLFKLSEFEYAPYAGVAVFHQTAWVNPERFLAEPQAKQIEVAQILGQNWEHLKAHIEAHRDKPRLHLAQLTPERREKLRYQQRFKGVQTHERSEIRDYPYGAAAAHVVGFTAVDGRGISGIEYQYDAQLQGKNGYRIYWRNSLGQQIGKPEIDNDVPAIDGESVQLTIDMRVQQIAHDAAKQAALQHEAQSASAVVLDAHTGEILAMTTYPELDPGDAKQRGKARNSSIVDKFEPGSVIKPLVAALALDMRIIGPHTQIETGDTGYWQIYGHRISDDGKAYGEMTIEEVLMRSSNIGMAMIGDRLESLQLWTVFNALGFGKRPLGTFPGASTGTLNPVEKWRPINKITQAYGYYLDVSLLQLAQAYTALARGGEWIGVSLVKGQPATARLQVYSRKVANQVLGMMETAVSLKSSNKLQRWVPDYRLAGKTGTARATLNGAYVPDVYRGSFVAIAPVSAPRIVVATSIHHKARKTGYYGGSTAGPMATKIINEVLPYLGVPSDRSPQPPKGKS